MNKEGEEKRIGGKKEDSLSGLVLNLKTQVQLFKT